MSLSGSAKLRKRVARSEELVIGMGFLLEELHAQFGHDMSEGMEIQVVHAINDYRVMSRSIAQRESSKEDKQ